MVLSSNLYSPVTVGTPANYLQAAFVGTYTKNAAKLSLTIATAYYGIQLYSMYQELFSDAIIIVMQMNWQLASIMNIHSLVAKIQPSEAFIVSTYNCSLDQF